MFTSATLNTCNSVKDEHIEATLQAMKRRGTLNHSIVHGVFVGPANSGKNSLMERLLGRIPSLNTPSTGVAEAVVQVQVEKSSAVTVAANVEGSFWTGIDSNDEAIRLLVIHSDPNNVQIGLQEKQGDLEPNSLSELQSESTQKIEAQTEGKTSTPQSVHQLPESYIPPLKILERAISAKGLEALQQHFDSTWSLYLSNTGGQMEFQEILPLLVSGPCMFFCTFRLDRKLKERYTIEYRYSDGTNSSPYKSTLTTCLLYTSPSPRDATLSRMPSSA